MEVLSSRILIRPTDPDRSHRFYGEVLGLAVAREFGEGDTRGIVFFAGGGFIEVSGKATGTPRREGVGLWLQVRSIEEARAELATRGVEIVREPRLEPWGLKEMWIADPDGLAIGVIEVPEDHPLRRR